METVEDFQVKREAVNHLLKDAIKMAQGKYEYYANEKRLEDTFLVGKWVYLKLLPYK